MRFAGTATVSLLGWIGTVKQDGERRPASDAAALILRRPYRFYYKAHFWARQPPAA